MCEATYRIQISSKQTLQAVWHQPVVIGYHSLSYWNMLCRYKKPRRWPCYAMLWPCPSGHLERNQAIAKDGGITSKPWTQQGLKSQLASNKCFTDESCCGSFQENMGSTPKLILNIELQEFPVVLLTSTMHVGDAPMESPMENQCLLESCPAFPKITRKSAWDR